MKKIFFILLLLPLLSLSQNLVGVWFKTNESEIGIRFFENGSIELIDLNQPENKVLRNINVTYKKVKDNNNTYLIIQMFKNGKAFETKKIKYIYKNRKLYMPNFMVKENNEFIRRENEYQKLSKKKMKILFK